jgi:putative hemin transport protein
MATLGTKRLVDIAPDAPREERVEAARQSYERDRNQMTSVLARQYDLTEVEVVDILPMEQVTPLDASHWEEIIRALEEVGDVHVIVSNTAGVIEVFGRFGNFSRTGPFFNVQTKSIDMHLRPDTLARIFAIEKPGHMDGVSTISIQFFTSKGDAAFKVFFTFGGKAPSPDRRAQWEAIRDRYRLP